MQNSKNYSEFRNFGIFVGIFFPLIFGFIIPFIRGHSFINWTLYIAIPLLIIGFLKPKLLSRPYYLWIEIGNFLGWINSHIILTFLFYIVLLPTSLIMRFFQYDPLRLSRKNKKSYKEYIKHRKIDLNKIF